MPKVSIGMAVLALMGLVLAAPHAAAQNPCPPVQGCVTNTVEAAEQAVNETKEAAEQAVNETKEAAEQAVNETKRAAEQAGEDVVQEWEHWRDQTVSDVDQRVKNIQDAYDKLYTDHIAPLVTAADEFADTAAGEVIGACDVQTGMCSPAIDRLKEPPEIELPSLDDHVPSGDDLRRILALALHEGVM